MDTTVRSQTKDKLYKLSDHYMDILLKHVTDIGKTDLVQMALVIKDDVKPLDQKWYMLSPHLAKNELTNLEKAGTISPSFFKFCISLLVSKKKDPSTHEVTYRIVINQKVLVLPVDENR